MGRESVQNGSEALVRTVQQFFEAQMVRGDVAFPEILNSSGIWMGIVAEEVVGVFFLDDMAQQRVSRYKERGVHPFPGFMIGESKRPPGQRAAHYVTTPFRAYQGKVSAGSFAFSIDQDGSCFVINHNHELFGPSGHKVRYGVDFALLLGFAEEESLQDVEGRLTGLLNHCVDTWKTSAQ